MTYLGLQHIHLKPQMTPASSEKGEQSGHRLRGPLSIAEPPGHSRDQQLSLVVVMVSLLPQQQPFPLGQAAGGMPACLPKVQNLLLLVGEL